LEDFYYLGCFEHPALKYLIKKFLAYKLLYKHPFRTVLERKPL